MDSPAVKYQIHPVENASPVVNLDCACCVDKLMVREASKALSEFKGSLE